MFKKLKDKLAEEVKSSPQRIQQFAQAAQAAVTSASSSISDITNNDLFSIGDTDGQATPTNSKLAPAPLTRTNAFQDVSLTPHPVPTLLHEDSAEHFFPNIVEAQRQRRLSNSSFTSDVSFKLPSYESPSMYHFQSDMDVSASEAEERGLASPGGAAGGLDRVTKEQLFAAYRRTQERYRKYRSQYADLARHYKLLERENAKARSVLVETQDKALRRISELREQCSLEQSAKAHLERALREDIDERNIKIDTLTTKIQLLQTNTDEREKAVTKELSKAAEISPSDAQLVDLSVDSVTPVDPEPVTVEVTALNNKIEKMELLMNKYKESLKAIKEKNSQLTTELQVVSKDLENKTKEYEVLSITTTHLTEARQKIQELKDINEELQNKINTYDFTKTKEISTLEIDYRKAQEEICELKSKINTFSKREEEYAISLAENKLSIHKELESKEAEIKALKDNLSECNKEVESLSIVINDHKNNISFLEEDRAKLKIDITELKHMKINLSEKEIELEGLKQKYQILEQSKTKADESYKCLELQSKQETAEKLAIIDRNAYLENRNKQISDENTKKTAQLKKLEIELEELRREKEINQDVEKNKASDEIHLWKEKYKTLESEIQEEREELVKLQLEIEKLLCNHDSVQTENSTLKDLVTLMKSEAGKNQDAYDNLKCSVKDKLNKIQEKIKGVKEIASHLTYQVKTLKIAFDTENHTLMNSLTDIIKGLHHETEIQTVRSSYDALKTELHQLEDEISSLKQKHEVTLEDIVALSEEKATLQDKIIYADNEKKRFVAQYEQMSNTTDENVKHLAAIEKLKNENLTMAIKIDETEKECSHVKDQLKQANEKYMLDVEKIKNEKEELIFKASEQEIRHSTSLNEIKKENLALITKIQNYECSKTDEEKLQKINDELIHENSTLKQNFESIANNFKILENELAEVRRSHSEIETEKDRLSTIIEIFEQNEVKSAKDRQTIEILQTQLDSALEETNILKSKCEAVKQEKEDLYEQIMTLEQKATENERIMEDNQKAIDNISAQNKKLQNDYERQHSELQITKEQLTLQLTDKGNVTSSTDLSQKCEEIEIECESLKDENRRLRSDIEGLQTYLTKISKENSSLNDKLREVIASSETTESHDSSVLLQDIQSLKNDIEKEKEKTTDLLRQNTLLAEENLELKDQLQSQNYVRPVEMKAIELNANELNQSRTDLATYKDKYESAMKCKSELEDKLYNSEHMSQSVNNNVRQLQESNHKLRTSNEKLERRLDEALVSLRHLHSLQENTELEYLRNVLFEYLTGSGTHSETLAKVLAAVVKFDDKQTQQVLLKERERQGLLRQLKLL